MPRPGIVARDAEGRGLPAPPPPVVVPDLPPELANVPAAILRRDAMLAYKALGGHAYFMKNEPLLMKTLLKLLPNEVQQQTQTDVQINITWASADRLSYRNAPQDVIDADGPEDAVERPKAVAWKEPAPSAEFSREVRAVVEAHKPLTPSTPRPKDED